MVQIPSMSSCDRERCSILYLPSSSSIDALAVAGDRDRPRVGDDCDKSNINCSVSSTSLSSTRVTGSLMVGTSGDNVRGTEVRTL